MKFIKVALINVQQWSRGALQCYPCHEHEKSKIISFKLVLILFQNCQIFNFFIFLVNLHERDWKLHFWWDRKSVAHRVTPRDKPSVCDSLKSILSTLHWYFVTIYVTVTDCKYTIVRKRWWVNDEPL